MRINKLFKFFTLLATVSSHAMQTELRTDLVAGTILCEAAERGDVARITELLKEIHPNARARNNCTALIHAVSKGHLEVCQLLIQSGADVNAANKSCQPALFFSKGPKVAELLLDNGAHINPVDALGQSALFFLFRFKDSDSETCDVLMNRLFRIPSPQQKTRMLCFIWCMEHPDLKERHSQLNFRSLKPIFIKALRALIEEENRGILHGSESQDDLRHESIAYQEVCKLDKNLAKQHLMEKYFTGVANENK